MDRFKFRVWDDKDKTYKYNHPYNGIGLFYIAENGNLFSDFGNAVAPEINKERLIIQQCTGLKDKNGKLIYEGDVVRFNSIIGKKTLRTVERDICNPCFVLKEVKNKDYKGYVDYEFDFIQCDRAEIEIIGSIHENPELLKD